MIMLKHIANRSRFTNYLMTGDGLLFLGAWINSRSSSFQTCNKLSHVNIVLVLSKYFILSDIFCKLTNRREYEFFKFFNI